MLIVFLHLSTLSVCINYFDGAKEKNGFKNAYTGLYI